MAQLKTDSTKVDTTDWGYFFEMAVDSSGIVELNYNQQAANDTTTIPTVASTDVDLSGFVGKESVYGLLGEKYLDPDLLVAEADEYMQLGKTLGHGMSPWDWSDENLNFSGWDYGYKVGAQENIKSDAPGYEDTYLEQSGRQVSGASDKYFYNLALTQSYQEMSDLLIKTKGLSQEEINTLQGSKLPRGGVATLPYNPLASGKHAYAYSAATAPKSRRKKTYQGYEGIINKYLGDEGIKKLHEQASLKAMEWGGSYRKELKGKFTDVIGKIGEADIEHKTGQIVQSLNDMLNITDDIDALSDISNKLENVSDKDKSDGAAQIIKSLKKINDDNLDTEVKNVGNLHDPNDATQTKLIGDFTTSLKMLTNKIKLEEERIERSLAGEGGGWLGGEFALFESGGRIRAQGRIDEYNKQIQELGTTPKKKVKK